MENSIPKPTIATQKRVFSCLLNSEVPGFSQLTIIAKTFTYIKKEFFLQPHGFSTPSIHFKKICSGKFTTWFFSHSKFADEPVFTRKYLLILLLVSFVSLVYLHSPRGVLSYYKPLVNTEFSILS